MKKTALAMILTIVLFSTVFISQTLNLASANPGWKPWENEISYPTLDVYSPIAGESYPSNKLWLNFTLTKPLDWLNKTDCYISYVTYCVDGSASGPNGQISDDSDENETIIQVQDFQGVANPPTSFSFSFDLEGLSDGEHTLEILVEGNHEWTGFGYTFPRTNFVVYASSPTPAPTASPTTSEPFPTLVTASVSVLAAMVGLGLFVYFKKHRRQPGLEKNS